MGLLDFLKQKEFTEIASLKTEIALVQKDLETIKEREIRLTLENSDLKTERDNLIKYKDIADIEQQKECLLSEIKEQKEHYIKEKYDIENDLSALKSEIKELTNEIQEKKSQIIELDNTVLLQEYGMYSPTYDFANSEMYKDRLDAIRTEQKT